MSDNQDYPSHYTPPPWQRGPMTSVDGDYAPQGKPSSIPSAFGGGNVDLASAFEGQLQDQKAVNQELLRTLESIGIMAQRVSAMLGGTATGDSDSYTAPATSVGAAAGVAGIPQAGTFAPGDTSAAAVINAALGTSYGSGMGAGPQMSALGMMPSGPFGGGGGIGISPQMIGDATAPPVSIGAGGGTVPDSNPAFAAPTTNQDQPGYGPAQPGESAPSDIGKYLKGALGATFFEKRGAQEAGGSITGTLRNPSVRGIAGLLNKTSLGPSIQRWGQQHTYEQVNVLWRPWINPLRAKRP